MGSFGGLHTRFCYLSSIKFIWSSYPRERIEETRKEGRRRAQVAPFFWLFGPAPHRVFIIHLVLIYFLPLRGGVMGRPELMPPYGNFFLSAGFRIWKIKHKVYIIIIIIVMIITIIVIVIIIIILIIIIIIMIFI